MVRIAAAVAAVILSAMVIVLAVYGPQWILQGPYIRDLSVENVRAHGLPKWWHAANLFVVACIVGIALLKRRAKRAAKKKRLSSLGLD
jgi:hypothetical protein